VLAITQEHAEEIVMKLIASGELEEVEDINHDDA
jgi:hypothetical protein